MKSSLSMYFPGVINSSTISYLLLVSVTPYYKFQVLNFSSKTPINYARKIKYNQIVLLSSSLLASFVSS